MFVLKQPFKGNVGLSWGGRWKSLKLSLDSRKLAEDLQKKRELLLADAGLTSLELPSADQKLCMYVCMHACMYVGMYVCMHIYIYIHTYSLIV